MSADAPKVRDFTTQDRSLPVSVETSPVYELLLSLFVWGSETEAMQYDCGSKYFEDIEANASAALAAELKVMSGCDALWLPLMGLARAAGKIGSVGEFAEYIQAMDPVALRRKLVEGACHKGELTPEEAEAAAAGDPVAVEKALNAPYVEEGFRSLMETELSEVGTRVASLLISFNELVEQQISDSLPALRRDADEKRSLARSMRAQTLVETATNGVTFEMQADMTGVLLIPSKIIRPWTVMSDHEGLQIFAYSVADEHLNADPDAPPGYLVELYKALGDERRLKMLAFLADEPRSLMEVAEHVDLAKSTAHHHLRILRSAGLVRVTVGTNKTYSLREDRVPEAARLLDAYLTTPAQIAQSAPTTEEQRS